MLHYFVSCIAVVHPEILQKHFTLDLKEESSSCFSFHKAFTENIEESREWDWIRQDLEHMHKALGLCPNKPLSLDGMVNLNLNFSVHFLIICSPSYNCKPFICWTEKEMFENMFTLLLPYNECSKTHQKHTSITRVHTTYAVYAKSSKAVQTCLLLYGG